MTTIEELRALSDAATPGEWRVGGFEGAPSYLQHADPDSTYPEPGWADVHWDTEGLGAIWLNEDDPTFIVAAVNYVRSLFPTEPRVDR